MAYDYHKEAKASRAKKLKSYKSTDPHTKVDSSDWTPAEPLNADVKTGMRPVSKRAYKRGGKVAHKIEGAHSKMRHDRKARKSGGKTGEMPLVDRFVNRDMHKANDYRSGEKHVGGMKTGGRAKKAIGGADMGMMSPVSPVAQASQRIANMASSAPTTGMNTGIPTRAMRVSPMLSGHMNKGGKVKHPDEAEDKKLIKKMVKTSAMKREEHCWGGKANGGKTSAHESHWGDEAAYRNKRWDESKEKWVNKKPKSFVGSDKEIGSMGPSEHDNTDKFRPGEMNKGGRAKHNKGGGVFSGNSKEKIPGATGGRKAKMGGGGFRPSELTQYEMARRPAVQATDDYLMDSANNEDKLRDATRNFERVAGETGYSNRKHGGRSKHAAGGAAKGKGKTDIKIIVAPHSGQPMAQQQPAGGMMPPQPVPMPARPPMGNMPVGGAPMGMDPNLALLAARGGAGPQPQPQMPMGRKTGGRVARTEHVIDHAAGGGLGRLEKIKAYGYKGK